MTSLTRDLAPPARRPPGRDPLTMRITGGGLDGRVVRLRSPKCTVGSGSRCTLRLLGAGIRPLHCLIVRADRGTFIRRWSPDTRLNGRSFQDAALCAGDRLTVGPLHLEVLPDEAERTASDPFDSAVAVPSEGTTGTDSTQGEATGGSESTESSTEDATLHSLRDKIATQRKRARGLVEALRTSRRQREEAAAAAHVSDATGDALRDQITTQRKRVRGLVEALRASRRQEQELTAEIDAGRMAQQQAEERLGQISSEAGEADHRTTALQARLEVLEQERDRLVEQYETAQQELQQLRESRVEDAPASDANRSPEADGQAADLDALQARIHELSAELEAHKERERALITQLKLAKERQTALRQRIQEVSSEQADRSSEVDARLAELEREKQEIADLRGEFQQERDRLAAERSAWERERSQEPSPDDDHAAALPPEASGKEAEAAIAHLRDLSLWSESASRAEEPEAPPSPAAPPASGAPVSFLEQYAPHLLEEEPADAPTSPQAEADSPPKADDDESLSEYMAKLMQRVRGDEAPSAAGSRKPDPQRTGPASPPSQSATPAKVATEPTHPKSVDPDADPQAEPAPFRLQDIKRPGTLPERSGNFAAMRELANESAHSAISKYRVRRVVRDTVTTLISGGICLGTGITALYLAAELQSAATVGGAAGLLLAAYLFIRGTLNLLAIIREGRDSGKRRPAAKQRPKPTAVEIADDAPATGTPAEPAPAPADERSP